jgi:hypothetical protein
MARAVVAPVKRQVGARRCHAVTVQRIAPAQRSDHGARVRVEQQLVGVVAVALLGLVRPMRAVAVQLPGLQALEVAVPDAVSALGELDTRQLAAAAGVEQAQVHLLGMAGEDGEIGATPVPG